MRKPIKVLALSSELPVANKINNEPIAANGWKT
jgi:hypothetical protein